MSHVKYVWVSPNKNASCPYINESCLVCVGVPRENESCHVWMSRVKYEWVMSNMCGYPQIRMPHVQLYINESCPVCVGVPKENKSCHVWMSRVKYEWVMSNMGGFPQIRMPHVQPIYKWVMSSMCGCPHMRMSHIMYEWVVSNRNGHIMHEWVVSNVRGYPRMRMHPATYEDEYTKCTWWIQRVYSATHPKLPTPNPYTQHPDNLDPRPWNVSTKT